MNGNGDWWLGEADGQRGYVPSNYIRKSEYTWTSIALWIKMYYDEGLICIQMEQKTNKHRDTLWCTRTSVVVGFDCRKEWFCCWLFSSNLTYIYRFYTYLVLTGSFSISASIPRGKPVKCTRVCHIFLWNEVNVSEQSISYSSTLGDCNGNVNF